MSHALLRLAVATLFLLPSAALAADQPKAGGPKATAADTNLPPGTRPLSIGDPAPDFSLKGVDGKTYTLADFKDAPILMVAFLSNHCPSSHATETRLLPLMADMKKH